MPASTQHRDAPEFYWVCSIREGIVPSEPVFVRTPFVYGFETLQANGTSVVQRDFFFSQCRKSSDGVLDALAEAEVDCRVSHYRRLGWYFVLRGLREMVMGERCACRQQREQADKRPAQMTETPSLRVCAPRSHA